MKKFRNVVVVFCLAVTFVNCKSDKKNDYSKSKTTNVVEAKKSNAPFVLKKATNDINFIAYKTTDKVPVGGKFKKVKITNGGEGNSVKEAINNAEFSIPVSSIFTKDTSRDYKIMKFFFGVMEDTKLLSGKFLLNDDTNGDLEIKMNGVIQKVPFTYSIDGKTFAMQTKIDINNWNAAKALQSLNKVCYDLHTGADGVSKTWEEVAINVTSNF